MPAYSVSTRIPPAAGAAKQECNNGEREKAGVKTNRRTNKAEIRIEGWEGVLVYTAKDFWEIASLGGIVQELLHRTILEEAKMKAATMKPGRAR